MISLLSLVPVPDVPPEPPPPTSASTLGWALIALGLAGMLGFAVITVRAILNVSFRKHEIRLAAWLSFGGIALLALSYVDWRIHHHRQDAARDTWWEARQQADDVAQAALEKKYGITFTDPVLVFPIEEDPLPWEMHVELTDGSPSSCWLSNAHDYFTISCGPDESTATPLAVVGNDHSESDEHPAPATDGNS
ncbi:hypothetical protein H9657_17780 [Cellulomonas sp. Sa3CUA2]|uniref:Uncharacterized protein n=1 Tax=Cellulomonas avistercoris TaxID=2762242 RepID=A0ABR8QI71_9CELL|nr:hypothetical protein [Cellulomonas avistercoris]MBD7920126.1 hypothetical protein [Cellulomonas avistercoris]